MSVALIKTVASALGDLNKNSVFVGGATVPFYLPDTLKATARPTEDIDVVIELIPKQKLKDFEDLLRSKGFANDTSEGAPICRWKLGSITVDIMSPDEAVLGFTNKWYAEGIKHADTIDLAGQKVQIMTLPYFLATKIEAFKGRGEGDYMGSPDMEDIITVMDGTSGEDWNGHISQMKGDVREYLKVEFSELLGSRGFTEVVPGAISDRQQADARAKLVIGKMEELTKS